MAEKKAAAAEGATEATSVPEKKSKAAKSSGNGASSIDQIITSVEQLTVLELVDLVKALEDRFGVTAAVPMAVAAAPAAGGDAGAAAEEQTEFTVQLISHGEKKIQVIKVVREVTSLGLKEAKDLVEGAPCPVKEGVSKDEAASLKAKLEEAGATVDIQ